MTCQREKELLEQIEQTGEMYKVSAPQLIKAGKRIAELESTLDRRTLQFDGTRHTPCAKHCEATAFWIDERRLRARIAELESLNGALCRDSAGFVQERDALATRVEVMRAALEGAVEYTALLDDFTQAAMREALALPDTSADILRARDARVNAELLYALAAGQDAFDEGTGLLPFQMRKMAEDLEENNG